MIIKHEQERKEGLTEIMEIPNIAIVEEKGAQAVSLALKAKNPEWGEHDNPVAKGAEAYFKENPPGAEVISFLDRINALKEGGVDEEVLYLFSLTYGYPERTNKVFEIINRYKPYVKNPDSLRQGVFRIIKAMNELVSGSQLASQMALATEEDKRTRLDSLPETRERIERLITFFRPKAETTKVKTLSLMTTDMLYRRESGRSFDFGDELVLMSHRENNSNQEHEFLHCVINPIVEKLSQLLTEEGKEKISRLASVRLKKDYGEGYFSLLCEELIRTYHAFKRGEKPPTLEDFQKRVSEMTEDQFQRALAQSKDLRVWCLERGIVDNVSFGERSEEYFNEFEGNELRELIFELYEEYVSLRDESFESFVLRRFPEVLGA